MAFSVLRVNTGRHILHNNIKPILIFNISKNILKKEKSDIDNRRNFSFVIIIYNFCKFIIAIAIIEFFYPLLTLFMYLCCIFIGKDFIV